MSERSFDPWNAYNSLVANARDQASQGPGDAVEMFAAREARRRDLIDLANAHNEMMYVTASAIIAVAGPDGTAKQVALEKLIDSIKGYQRFFQAFSIRMLSTDDEADLFANAIVPQND